MTCRAVSALGRRQGKAHMFSALKAKDVSAMINELLGIPQVTWGA